MNPVEKAVPGRHGKVLHVISEQGDPPSVWIRLVDSRTLQDQAALIDAADLIHAITSVVRDLPEPPEPAKGAA